MNMRLLPCQTARPSRWSGFAPARALGTACALLLLSVGTATTQASSQCDILSLSAYGRSGEIYEWGDYGEIYVLVPYGSDLTSVSPTITLSPGATVDPASGEEVFPDPYDGYFLYTVTAEDGVTQKEYDVYFLEGDPTAEMLGMSFGSNAANFEKINDDVWFVTYATTGDITALAPTYTLSEGATCDIPSGTTKDFTNAVEYTVFSADGFYSTTYVVMVTVDAPLFIDADGSGMLGFGKKPPVSAWSTLSVPGAAVDITTAASMDAAMNAIAANGINAPLASYNGAAMGGAFWRFDQLRLGTQPTGNKMTLLKATLKNTSGGTIGGLAVSYRLGATTPPAEQIDGYRLYWSLSGDAGTWNSAGTHPASGTGVATVDFNIEFPLGWADQETLHVVWADDNGTGVQGSLTIDEASFTPMEPAANMLSFSAAGVDADISGTEIDMVAPPGVDVSSLAPVYALSYGATCTIASGTPRDFSNPVIYTVTSSDGAVTRDYVVTIASSYWTQGLLAEFFRFSTGYASLPEFTTMTPEMTRVDAQINYPSTNGAWSGLPSDLTDNFGARHTGAVRIDVGGTYTFYLTSDDGSTLWLDNALLVNNDGLHAMQERSATVNLAVGYHPLRVEFFEGGGGAGITLQWTGPGIPKQLVPASALYRLGSATRITTTELASSLNPSSTGQSVAFTATLRYGGAVATAATGTYAFRRNGVVAAVVPLTNGTATYTTSSLPPGSHIIEASYSGDDNYRPSEASLTQTNSTSVTLTVNNGSGSGTYLSGTTVAITANAPGLGKIFAGWVADSGDPALADASAANTTLTMPATNVTVTASYRGVPPAGVTPLAWYDAADADTIVLESGKVSEWRDKSGNDHHATQSNGSFRPTKETDGLRFGADDAHLSLPIMAGDAWTVMMVTKNDGVMTRNSFPQMPLSLQTYAAGTAFGSSGSQLSREVVAVLDSSAAFYYTDRQGVSDANLSSISPTSHLYSFVLDGDWHIGMDGSANLRNLTSGVRHPLLFSQVEGGIGANVRQKTSDTSPVDQEWSGTISEIILIPNAVDQAQRQEIEGYLAHKWDAIHGDTVLRDALPVNHPYKTTPPGTNTPPVAVAQSVTAPAATATPITLTADDPDSDPLSFAIVTPPSHGQLTGTPPSVTYTPTFGYSGADAFTFKVNDGQEDSAPATVSITVEEGDPYAQWLELTGYVLAGGPDDDDDSDGLSNFDEFAFGLDPTRGSSANPIVAPLDRSTHSFTYNRYAYSKLSYTVWISMDLEYWGENPAAVNEVVGAPDSKGVVIVQATLNAPPSDARKLFVRVQAE